MFLQGVDIEFLYGTTKNCGNENYSNDNVIVEYVWIVLRNQKWEYIFKVDHASWCEFRYILERR